ncbi:menaquinone-dependent protoporphyrinogen IX dehydrogenase [Methylomonas methanica]|uniref:Protoporphyrinogen IX dehydrogenase [quinone] n=1 Tax=Methylomonas methanica (strain DSM 25384 / MC09) TaxID=857087 RepID=G0A5B6_METMM|nr:menaquinone-dependent protoporphyrinogen IX dehydrogenase [Methylomonas methanica]AEG01622.1 Protoporphyrinogen oxidase [Methylomonas methanica MC09]
MSHILLVYASHDGQTEKICRTLQTIIQQAGQQITVLSIDQAAQADPAAFDKIVIGASIRYGKHGPEIAAFIKQNQAILDSKPNAFFSVNLVARKPEKSSPASNPYLQKFLKRITWHPKHLAVFAGKIDYPSYGLFDRLLIRLIMWMTHGPTDPKAVIEFTDWEQVKAFGQQIANM